MLWINSADTLLFNIGTRVFLENAVMRYYMSEGIAVAALTEADLKHSVG